MLVPRKLKTRSSQVPLFSVCRHFKLGFLLRIYAAFLHRKLQKSLRNKSFLPDAIHSSISPRIHRLRRSRHCSERISPLARRQQDVGQWNVCEDCGRGGALFAADCGRSRSRRWIYNRRMDVSRKRILQILGGNRILLWRHCSRSHLAVEPVEEKMKGNK